MTTAAKITSAAAVVALLSFGGSLVIDLGGWIARASDAIEQVPINAEGVELLKEIHARQESNDAAEERGKWDAIRELCLQGTLEGPPCAAIPEPVAAPPPPATVAEP